MNVYKSVRILFMLCLGFSSIKHAAKTLETKMVDSDKQKGPIGLKLLKPFQVAKNKPIDMDDYQKNTLQWVHKRLLLFFQKLDEDVFITKKPENKRKFERVRDKATVFSLQWQDIKSHYLIPMAKHHIPLPLISDETMRDLEKVRNAFFVVLKRYQKKLQLLKTSKAIIVEDKYHVYPNPKYNEERDLWEPRAALHQEIYLLLKDLPRYVMHWSSDDIRNIQDTAEILGPLPAPAQNDDFGDDDENTLTQTQEDFDETASDHENSNSSSSDSSSESSDEEYKSDYIDSLPPDYFMSSDSDDEHALHGKPPGYVEPSAPTVTPSYDESDDTDRILRSLQEGIQWNEEAEVARQRLRKSLGENDNGRIENDPEITQLENRLLLSLINMGKDEKLMNVIGENDPEIKNLLERMKKLRLEKSQNHSGLHSSHSSESSSHLHPEKTGSSLAGKRLELGIKGSMSVEQEKLERE